MGNAGLEMVSRAQITVCPVKVISFKYRGFEMVTHQMSMINIIVYVMFMYASLYKYDPLKKKDNLASQSFIMLSFPNSNHDETLRKRINKKVFSHNGVGECGRKILQEQFCQWLPSPPTHTCQRHPHSCLHSSVQ